jgi:Auxiliary Activity family 9 (formerly GH61)
MPKTRTNSVAIPKCIQAGDYLLRIEQVGLHVAQSLDGAQFYLSCAQLTVIGGGNALPSPLVAFPGAHKASESGLLINIYYPMPQTYQDPGPEVFSLGAMSAASSRDRYSLSG